MGKSLRGAMRRVGVVGATAALTMTLASTGSASAAARGEAYAYGPEVFGSANWTWGYASMSNINMAVRDTQCDGNPVYIRFITMVAPAASQRTQKRWNNNGCRGNDAYWENLSFESVGHLDGVKVEVCVDDAFVDTCYESAGLDNPVTR